MYVSASDRRVSYGFLTRLTIGLNCHVSLMVGRSDMSKFTEGSWQGPMKEWFDIEIQKNAVREFLQGQNLFLNSCRLVFQRLPIAADAMPQKKTI